MKRPRIALRDLVCALLLLVGFAIIGASLGMAGGLRELFDLGWQPEDVTR